MHTRPLSGGHTSAFKTPFVSLQLLLGLQRLAARSSCVRNAWTLAPFEMDDGRAESALLRSIGTAPPSPLHGDRELDWEACRRAAASLVRKHGAFWDELSRRGGWLPISSFTDVDTDTADPSARTAHAAGTLVAVADILRGAGAQVAVTDAGVSARVPAFACGVPSAALTVMPDLTSHSGLVASELGPSVARAHGPHFSGTGS